MSVTFVGRHLCQKKNTRQPPPTSILDALEAEEVKLFDRSLDIQELIPALEQELEQIKLKLEALVNAKAALAEVYGGGEHEAV